MFDIIDMYCKYVIKPVEEHTKELRKQVANKGIIEKIFHIDYKDQALEKMELMLYDCYIKLSTIIKEEIEFNNYIQEELKKLEVK